MVTWDVVRELALELPETEESTSWRQPCFRVRGKWFAGLSPHEEGALVLKCDPDERALMLEAASDVFWTTPHYDGSPGFVLVRLHAIEREELADRLVDSWLRSAPKGLAASLQGARQR